MKFQLFSGIQDIIIFYIGSDYAHILKTDRFTGVSPLAAADIEDPRSPL
jgi:hypothetical protein